jgi:hypothetical protein
MVAEWRELRRALALREVPYDAALVYAVRRLSTAPETLVARAEVL